MTTLDLSSLKAESSDDFLDAAGDNQHFHDESQFELYGLTNQCLAAQQENVYPVPFHPHTPYTQLANGGACTGLHAGRTFANGGSEDFGKTPPQPRHGKLLNSGSPLKHHGGVSSATTAGRAYDNCHKSRATYSGRRSTSERRDRINERERDRMHMLCDAFEQLRQVLPLKRPKRGPHRQKLSKICTLVFAQNYIRTLEDILRNPAEYADCQLPSSDDAGRAGCATLNSATMPVPNQSTEAEFELFSQSEFYHQQYPSDAFVDTSYATF